MTRDITTYLVLAFLLAIPFASCSDAVHFEGEGKGEVREACVTMTIGTRATGVPEGAQADVEKIRTWWVAFVDKDGIVRHVESRSPLLTTYVEQERIEINVPTGTYTLYAFANITPEALKAETGVEFIVGSTYPSAIETAEYTLVQHWASGTDLPMSGKQQVTVTGRANEVFSIEVVRMLAKMDVRFANESRKQVTINSLKMSQSATDVVPLLPNYTYLESGWDTDVPCTAREYLRTYSSLLAAAPVLDAYDGVSANGYVDIFYVRESQANYNVTGRYLMSVNITREGGNPEDLLFALTKDLRSIYRNDHVVIPVILSDYQVSLDVNFYPPIGGYPAVITEESQEGFYCKFGTEGDFEIYPKVEDTYNGYVLLYGTGDPKFTYTISVSDPEDIFTTKPAVTPSGEMLGCIGNTPGKAYVDVKITVSRTGVTDQIYDRRIYIIRE
ncbi:MAG: hypothetical protein ACI3X7_00030 [Bacteroidaceae bacterium]